VPACPTRAVSWAPRITFAAGKLPPVRGFWSLTLYNEHHFLFPHDLHRCSLGTKNKTLIYGAAGSPTPYAAATSLGRRPRTKLATRSRQVLPQPARLRRSGTSPRRLLDTAHDHDRQPLSEPAPKTTYLGHLPAAREP